VFATFESEAEYFGSRAEQTMLNFRVRDLDAMLAQLRAKGADVGCASAAPYLCRDPASSAGGGLGGLDCICVWGVRVRGWRCGWCARGRPALSRSAIRWVSGSAT
jgi:hypothetical protein